MTAFHEVRFPPDISYGTTGGPAFSTTVFQAASGFEQRNVNWAEAHRAFGRHPEPGEPAAGLSFSSTLSQGYGPLPDDRPEDAEHRD